jgi:hypothetical protein
MHSEVAEKICHIPVVFDATDCSTAQLVERSGLRDVPDALTEPEVEEILREEPKLADLWLERAGDQRLVGGWVMDCKGRSYYLKNFKSGRDCTFADRYKACAAFVVHYIDLIRHVLDKYDPHTARGRSGLNAHPQAR